MTIESMRAKRTEWRVEVGRLRCESGSGSPTKMPPSVRVVLVLTKVRAFSPSRERIRFFSDTLRRPKEEGTKKGDVSTAISKDPINASGSN